MRRRLTRKFCGALIIALAFCAFDASDEPRDVKAADPVGAWKLKCVSPDGKDRECIVTVSRDEDVWKGTYQSDGTMRPANDVAFNEGVLSFRVDGKFAGQVYYLTYNGKPQGDTLDGTVRWSYGWASGSFAFRGERVLERVASTP